MNYVHVLSSDGAVIAMPVTLVDALADFKYPVSRWPYQSQFNARTLLQVSGAFVIAPVTH